jgi:hypothetical protein
VAGPSWHWNWNGQLSMTLHHGGHAMQMVHLFNAKVTVQYLPIPLQPQKSIQMYTFTLQHGLLNKNLHKGSTAIR